MGRRSREAHWLPLPLLISWVMLSVPSDAALRILRAPPAFSASPAATFLFEVTNGGACGNCSFFCQLDNNTSSACDSKQVTYSGLLDGDHMFEACVSGSQRVRCASYNWTVDTIPPTAYVSVASPFTNASNVLVNVSFSERCTGEGGFRCTPSNCNLIVYGAGKVLPSTLKVLLPDKEFSVMVEISADTQFGRLVIVMDKDFCTDNAGNRFKRTSNSSFILHYDRRIVSLNLTTRIPAKVFQLNGENRTAEATNASKNLKVFLSFSEPVLNSTAEILGVLHSSSGFLVPTNRTTHGNRHFSYLVNNLSSMSVVAISCDAARIISRQGTPVSPSDPIAFLYDDRRPSVRLSTTSKMRTRQHKIPVLIKFVKPVFGFNSSAIIISGGHAMSFHEISKSIYVIEIRSNDSIISVKVPENQTADIAGNKNLQSNILQVKHYSKPTISSLVSIIATVIVAVTSMAAALLTVSTSSLLSSGALSRQKSYQVSEPSRNLLRFLCHIQVFALCRWLVATVPIEYYEFAMGMEWSIPYIRLPWETGSSFEDPGFTLGAYSEVSERSKLETFRFPSPANQTLVMDTSRNGRPLTAGEYFSFLENQNLKPEAEFILPSQNADGRWKYFGRNMFWLAVIGGGLILLHVAILGVLRLKNKNSEKKKEIGALVFSRFGDGDSGSTVSPSGRVQRASGTSERSWLRQLRELAKASFSREEAAPPNDPSSSTYQSGGFWSGKRSRSSSVTSSTDFKSKGDLKAKSKGLYKDLESIFSSK